MQAHRRKHRQVQHRDTGALQHQRVIIVSRSQPPTEAKQAQRRRRDTGVTQLDRHHHTFGGIAQQKGQAEEQQHHADPQHRVAAEQPGASAVDGTLDKVGAARDGRLLRLAGDRFGLPGIDGLGRQFPDQFRRFDRGLRDDDLRCRSGFTDSRFTGFRGSETG
ncbi:hypothetical protein D3C87_1374330 [compost metagenome]